MSLFTDEESGLFLHIGNKHYYHIQRKLLKNTWTQLSIVHSELNLQVYIDGISSFNANESNILFNSTKCDNNILKEFYLTSNFKLLSGLCFCFTKLYYFTKEIKNEIE
jgi:hypothetical protein